VRPFNASHRELHHRGGIEQCTDLHDDPLTATSTAIKAIRLTEMRSALAAVYTQRIMTPPTYTNSTLAATSMLVKAIDVSELRAAIQAIW
jgi:hypothetical protein